MGLIIQPMGHQAMITLALLQILVLHKVLKMIATTQIRKRTQLPIRVLKMMGHLMGNKTEILIQKEINRIKIKMEVIKKVKTKQRTTTTMMEHQHQAVKPIVQ